MARYGHLIRGLTSDAYPAQIIVADCDYVWEQVQCGLIKQVARMTGWVGVGCRLKNGAFLSEHWDGGVTKDEFWLSLQYVLRRPGRTWVFSERAVLMWTLLDLWGMIESGDVTLCGSDDRDVPAGRRRRHGNTGVRCVLEDPPTIIDFRTKDGQGSVRVVDVRNYGLELSSDEWTARERVTRHASFLREMIPALQSHSLGSLQSTAASQSMHGFKRGYLTHLMVADDNVAALNLEGSAYYGGRCEAFRLGRTRGPVYHLDVSSMYPYCYRNHAVPVGLCGVHVDLPPGDQDQLGAGCGLVADVQIETDEPAYPYRHAGLGITVWPIGTFRTVLCGPELNDALARDRVARWHRVAAYKMGPALAAYADAVFRMREEHKGNADMTCWVKRIGVSIVGKLGQKDRRWVNFESQLLHGPWETWWELDQRDRDVRCRSIAGQAQSEFVGPWSFDAMPAVSAWICSLARVRLLEMIRAAGWDAVLYLDTDALMVTRAGYLRLKRDGYVRDGTPGYLRIKTVSDEVEIHGIKSYDDAENSVRAGRPLSAAGNGSGEPRYWQRRGGRDCPRERSAPTASRVAIPWKETGKYKHGEVTAAGEVVPLQLRE